MQILSAAGKKVTADLANVQAGACGKDARANVGNRAEGSCNDKSADPGAIQTLQFWHPFWVQTIADKLSGGRSPHWPRTTTGCRLATFRVVEDRNLLLHRSLRSRQNPFCSRLQPQRRQASEATPFPPSSPRRRSSTWCNTPATTGCAAGSRALIQRRARTTTSAAARRWT